MSYHATITRQTFTFETYIERGRNEREYPVEVEYQILPSHKATSLTPAEPETVEIVRWTLIGADFDLTDRELDQLQDEAEAHAVEAISEYRAEAAEYRADSFLFGEELGLAPVEGLGL